MWSVERRALWKIFQTLGIDAEFHLFPNLRHGFGLGVGTSAQGWMDGAVAFWEKHMDHLSGLDDITIDK